jgi:hypothetical protein
MPAGRIDQPDPVASILSVTKYWESAIAQIGRCQAGLPDPSKERLNIELATWRKSCALSVLDEYKRKCTSPDETRR